MYEPIIMQMRTSLIGKSAFFHSICKNLCNNLEKNQSGSDMLNMYSIWITKPKREALTLESSAV